MKPPLRAALTLILLVPAAFPAIAAPAEASPPVAASAAAALVRDGGPAASTTAAQARRLARSLDDRTLAAQVLLTGIDGNGVLGNAMASLLQRAPAGGVMLFRYNLSGAKEGIPPFLKAVSNRIAASTTASTAAPTTTAAPSTTAAALGIPPLVAVDHEGGLVHRFGAGVGRLPTPLSYWDAAQAQGWEAALEGLEQAARTSGEELRSLGITWNLAPVAEVLTAENRPFLDDRSYGPDGEFVERAAAAFIRGMEGAGIGCVVKHFPGNTGADPHRGEAVLDVSREILDRMAEPMAALIRSPAAPGALMVSHVRALARDRERIASLSPAVIQDWLRGELGFEGIILADDFSMGAAAFSALSAEEAAVAALNAGADMVMTWPMNLTTVHAAILGALRDGRLPRERLVEAAERIIREKIRLGLIPPDPGEAP
jgi:beta-N-acetylhexosaminidase